MVETSLFGRGTWVRARAWVRGVGVSGVRTSVLPAEIGSRWCKLCETSSSPGQSIGRPNPLADNGAQLHWHAASQLARSLLVAGKVRWAMEDATREGKKELEGDRSLGNVTEPRDEMCWAAACGVSRSYHVACQYKRSCYACDAGFVDRCL